MYVDTKETAFLHDLSKPSLEALSHVLRHPEKWPRGFVWKYDNCDQCAMGMAHQLWEQIPETFRATATSTMAREFGIPYSASKRIFMNMKLDLWMKFTFREVTPDMVADEIDKYLASRKG